MISYDNGTHGTIDVKYPDVITGVNGGINCLQYSNVSNQFAAINFSGIFPDGNANGKIVYVGFPFETIYPEEERNIFLSKVIAFFQAPVDVSENLNLRPESFQLFQNYPNPFNPSTTISFTIPNSEKVLLKVFDPLGREVVTLIDGYKSSGKYDVQFNAENFPSGIYFYKLNAGHFVSTKKMILLK
jgi:hypothetical protein